MARVEVTRHLVSFFPKLGTLLEEGLQVEGDTVAAIIAALDAQVPGIGLYVCDERGRLRRHVNVFVDGEMVADRRQLGDRVQAQSTVIIMQALSGG